MNNKLSRDLDTPKKKETTAKNQEVISEALRNLPDSSVRDISSSKSEGWIDLEDMNGIPVAKYVPLHNEEGALIGYSVISDVEGENKILVTSIGLEAKIMAEAINKARIDSSDKVKLAYEYPDSFFIHAKGSYDKIFISEESANISDVERQDDVTVSLLSEQGEERKSPVTLYGSLNNWDYGDFVPVSDSGGLSYGGHQSWLTKEGITKFRADRSCGVTAVSNLLYYMAQNVPGKSGLYTKADITKMQFSQFQREVYNYISPAIWGVPSMKTMISRVETYAKDKNVPLKAHKGNLEWNEANVRDYIAAGLNNNCPVMLLTWDTVIPELTMHWVVVTRIHNDGRTKITTSNWGSKTEYDFLTWVNSSSLFKGVVYFE